ncbi:hypothetical protein Harman_40660 [Haloarcula mannanilytica]|uniref:Uncharacterized protein n=1 Tax=Haloarcula mannanilytica TaxID=2509225 RepID=A0A4C2ENM8_9EURY|nr:hypothetical protein Harman_40660 [Haloarcula mannanilytica]
MEGFRLAAIHPGERTIVSPDSPSSMGVDDIGLGRPKLDVLFERVDLLNEEAAKMTSDMQI